MSLEKKKRKGRKKEKKITNPGVRTLISKPWNLLARRVHREGCNAKGKHARAIIFFSRRVECGWIEGDARERKFAGNRAKTGCECGWIWRLPARELSSNANLNSVVSLEYRGRWGGRFGNIRSCLEW